MEHNKLKRGQEIELSISNLAFGGQGIAKVGDLIFFVKDAIPNQRILARISRIKKKYVEAYKVETLKKSKDEIDSKCEHFKYCGGCTIQQLDYEKQTYYKQQQVHDIFTRIGHIKDAQINTIIPCDKIFYYRNKMEYTFSGNPWYIDSETYDDVIIGLHVPKRFDKILSINACHINDPVFNELNTVIKEKVNALKFEPYDVVNHKGFLRFLVLRIGLHTDEIMVNLVTAGYKPKLIKPLIDTITNRFSNVTSIVNTINADKNNTAAGKTKLLYGENFISEKIGKYTFKVSANSFFQTNSYQVEKLYDYIVKTANFKKSDIVYDLYCGTGTIGIYVSEFVKKVYGIEIVKDAVKDAKYNAKVNKVNNANFFASDVKDFFKGSENIDKPNIVIIDPPRPGLHPDVVQDIISLSVPKIIYISCNPSTQARDVKIFIDNQYKIDDVQPVDMFPHTPHIECIVTLKK